MRLIRRDIVSLLIEPHLLRGSQNTEYAKVQKTGPLDVPLYLVGIQIHSKELRR